jgi:hypothetical protein
MRKQKQIAKSVLRLYFTLRFIRSMMAIKLPVTNRGLSMVLNLRMNFYFLILDLWENYDRELWGNDVSCDWWISAIIGGFRNENTWMVLIRAKTHEQTATNFQILSHIT